MMTAPVPGALRWLVAWRDWQIVGLSPETALRVARFGQLAYANDSRHAGAAKTRWRGA